MLAEGSLIGFSFAGDDVFVDAFRDGGAFSVVSLDLDQE